MKVVRMLVYEGPEEWVVRTLANENRYVQGRREFTKDSGIANQHPMLPNLPIVFASITELFFTEQSAMAEVFEKLKTLEGLWTKSKESKSNPTPEEK